MRPSPGMNSVVVATSLALCCQPHQRHLGVGDADAQLCGAKPLPKPPNRGGVNDLTGQIPGTKPCHAAQQDCANQCRASAGELNLGWTDWAAASSLPGARRMQLNRGLT